MRPRLILNADDLGLSIDVNRRIVECFAARRISSATLIANGPAFDDACELVHRHGLAGRIGVHLNLTEFRPLSAAARKLWNGGNLSFPESRLWTPASWAPIVGQELDAQIRRVLDADIQPTHADSHQHVLNGFPYLRVARSVLRRHGITRLRPARNRFYRRTPAKWAAKTAYNSLLYLWGFRSPRTFTDVKPLLDHVLAGRRPPAEPLEAMCHPGAPLPVPWRGVRDEADVLLRSETGEALDGFRLIGYGEL